jgi:ubiquinone biosynthesis protein UbiJ
MNRLDPHLERSALGLLRVLFHQNAWAAVRLSAFSGKTVVIEIGGEFPALPRPWVDLLPAAWPQLPPLRIARDGHLERAPHEVGADPQPPDVRLKLFWSAALVDQLRSREPKRLLEHLRIEGDVLLAAALGEVLSELHIDLGGLLAPITGDILAQRIEYHGRQVIGSLGSLVSGMASRLLGAGIQTRAMQR